ncbi:hypothetical protein [Actinoplanes sp. NPDC020271]|uniref:hypothetical protein n=1 Tax=Actinoplanes sp. NPDC020271 TaxID=3363896 RepID=UPI0037AFEF8A
MPCAERADQAYADDVAPVPGDPVLQFTVDALLGCREPRDEPLIRLFVRLNFGMVVSAGQPALSADLVRVRLSLVTTGRPQQRYAVVRRLRARSHAEASEPDSSTESAAIDAARHHRRWMAPYT